MDLVLASTSPYRRAQVERLGLTIRCVAPRVDEDGLRREWGDPPPRELAERLAAAKAASVAEVETGSTVIAGDQLVDFEGQVLGKPGSFEAAVAQLSAMAGREHRLITAMVVRRGDEIYAHTDITTLSLRSLTTQEIRRYVETDLPLDCAGSYKIEGPGIALFERIDSEDHSAIVGVPLIALTTILRGIGYPIP